MAKYKYIIGDILTPNINAEQVFVCHQVNCQGVMGAGLAKQVREKHPDVYDHYKRKCSHHDSTGSMLGDIQICRSDHNCGYYIVNIFGQDRYGRDKRHTDYAALAKAFGTISRALTDCIIRIPYNIGCGLGGGSWATVRSIIDKQIGDSNITVEFWSLSPINNEQIKEL